MVELASGDFWHSGPISGAYKAPPFASRISNTLITRGYTALNLHCQIMEDCLAVRAVLSYLVWARNSLLTGNLQGKYTIFT